MDLSAFASLGASLARGVTSTGAGTGAVPTADPTAVQRFTELMNAPATSSTAVPAAPPAVQAASAAAAPVAANNGGPAKTLGDAILNKISQVHGEVQANWQSLTSLGQSGQAMSAGDLLRFQSTAIQTSFQFDLIGKVVSKSTQNIETLVKMQ